MKHLWAGHLDADLLGFQINALCAVPTLEGWGLGDAVLAFSGPVWTLLVVMFKGDSRSRPSLPLARVWLISEAYAWGRHGTNVGTAPITKSHDSLS
jgi:hypothetical protein